MALDMPTVRLTVEGMTHNIIAALALHNDEIEEHLSTTITDLIRDYDWNYKIQIAAEQALAQAVNKAVAEFFLHGDGGRAVNAAVSEVLSKAVADGKL